MKKLLITWSKKEKDLVFHYEDHAYNGQLLHCFVNVIEYDGQTLRQALEERGYDITTLKFSIKKIE